MLSGGEKTRVVMELPTGKFYLESAQGQVFESKALGSFLREESVWKSVTRPFVDEYFLTGMSAEGEQNYSYHIDPTQCVFSLGVEAEALLHTNYPAAPVSQLIGASKFCLNASAIPAAQKKQMDLQLDSMGLTHEVFRVARAEAMENLKQIMPSREIDLVENLAAGMDDEMRVFYFVHMAQALLSNLSYVFDVNTFERGAQIAMVYAQASGVKNLDADTQKGISDIRPPVYAEVIRLIGEEGRQAVQNGDKVLVDAAIARLAEVGHRGIHPVGGMLEVCALLDHTLAELKQLKVNAALPPALAAAR